jgi:hypothetical protein
MLEAVFDTIGFLLRKCKCLCCSEYHTFNCPLLISTFQIFYEILFFEFEQSGFFRGESLGAQPCSNGTPFR